MKVDETRPRWFWSTVTLLAVLTTLIPAFDLGHWQRPDGDYLGGMATIWAVIATVYFGVPALRQARADARDRNRPMVAVELRPGELRPTWHSWIDVVLRNYGPVVARNIRVTFDPDLPDLPEDDPNRMFNVYIKRRHSRPIPTLTPGQELTQIYTLVRDGRLEGGMATVVTATVTCEGPDRHEWTDQFELDVDPILTTTYRRRA